MIRSIIFISIAGLIGNWFLSNADADPVSHHHSRVSNQVTEQIKSHYGMRSEGSGGSIIHDQIRRWTFDFRHYGRHTVDEAMEFYARVRNTCSDIIRLDEEVIPFLADDFNLDEGLNVGISYSEADGSRVASGEVRRVFYSEGNIVIGTEIGKWDPPKVIARRPLAEVEKQVFGDSSNPSS